jgi:hypothetical protein
VPQSLDQAQQLFSDQTSSSDQATLLGELMTDNNGVGAGFALGLGWAGKGFGLGLTMLSDNYTIGADLKVKTQMNGILGFAFPINLGALKLSFGLDGRAFLRTDSDGTWSLSTLLVSGADNSLPIINGYGFAADAGATLELGPLMVGGAIRDFGLQFDVGHGTLQDVVDMNIPLTATEAYILNPKLYAGIGLKFGQGKLVSPSAFVETSEIEAAIADLSNILSYVHAGAELKLLNFISLRGGMNRGRASFGAGIDLLLVEVDAAVFTEELGFATASIPRSGIAVQAAVRF